MAAQKYGPPLVGCALHISGTACHEVVPFRVRRKDVPAIAKPTNIVKKAVQHQVERLVLGRKETAPTNDNPTPHHNGWSTSSLQSIREQNFSMSFEDAHKAEEK